MSLTSISTAPALDSGEIHHSSTPFLGLTEGDLEAAEAVLLPVPYEATTSYGQGTSGGPQALLEASAYVELYDEVRDGQPAVRSSPKLGDPDGEALSRYWTATAVEFPAAFEPAMAAIYQRAAELVRPGRLLLSLGGEHSVSFPLFKAHLEHYPDFHILQIDAHCDLRDAYEGSQLSHASVMARAVELVGSRITQVGIRSICAEDRQSIRQHGIKTFFAHSLQNKSRQDWIPEVIDTLGERVYLTVDVDGLDPSVVPSTGTPEPGGLGWWDVVELIRAVGSQRQIIGADVMELSVTGNPELDRRSAFNVAKLSYQILAAALG
ncbi:MAG: agmatinase [Synechococcaceae cyanobacterium SM2_3_2]|nr:agmatinase [Synechococcaceae cyanobacterium SM2_3_2]